ncbi:MucBP domain-containing protein [Desnuesiella massiliensis]|uniref:MucBP domain-containing protein n=1 Tax=Desnuesiella massiliensis TaxID=1650662 RepID=UPI0006E1B4E8|nr:MucBP domain-containing protein [Desnuesiella massiliensis]
MKRFIALFTMFCLTLSMITINTSKVYAANIVNKTYKITVKDSSGNLMPNTWVLIVMPKGNFINWGVTDSSGFIQFDNVPVSDDTVISNREVDIYYSQKYYSHHIQSTYPNTSSGVNDVITTNLTLDNSSKYIAQVTYKSTNTPVMSGINIQVSSKFTLGNVGVPVPQAFYDYVIGQYSKSGVTDATGQVFFQLDTFNNFDVTYTKDDYNFTLSNDSYPSMGNSIKYYTRGVYIAPKGSVTVKYQDENSNDIAAPNVISNLDLGSYTYNAKSFPDYALNNSNSKSVTLTDSNAYQTIIFSYQKIKGSITVKYQDENNKDIAAPDVISNLDLGSYTENARSFLGYSLNDNKSKVVTLTDSNKDQTIIFSYKKDEAPKPVIKGSYTIQYKDQDGNILEQDVKSNLDLGKYTEQIKIFPGYALNDESSKTIELSELNKDQVITFIYKKITGIVEGTVTDIDGKPLKGVRVELHSNPQYTFTDENGHYKFTDVELGDHVIRISDTNYSSIKEFRISVAVDENNKPVTKVIDGSSTPSQDLSLSQDSNRRIVDFVVVPTSNKPQERLPQTGSPIDSKILIMIGFIFMALGGMVFSKKSIEHEEK